MAHNGPIVIIDDDSDDLDFLSEAISSIGVENEVIAFRDCNDALKFLDEDSSKPFLIFCDVNINGMDGITFKSRIDSNQRLREKSVPFIFLSTAVSQAIVTDMYGNLHIQGYFTKPDSMAQLRELIVQIIDYWSRAELPEH